MNLEERRGRDSNSRSTREPDLKSGAVPLGHRGWNKQSSEVGAINEYCADSDR
jgi:hypothetical protein